MTPGNQTATVGRVGGLCRYPIQSLDGERLDALRSNRRGVERDREWALVDTQGAIGSGKRTRRFRKARLGEPLSLPRL